MPSDGEEVMKQAALQWRIESIEEGSESLPKVKDKVPKEHKSERKMQSRSTMRSHVHFSSSLCQ